MATINIDYDYSFASSLESTAQNRHLKLATSGGQAKHPYFFSGRLLQPKQTADLLLELSVISRTRFFSPGELRERMIAAADPVVTSDGNQLRLEVFTVCCGAYARLDLKEDALDGQWFGKGTTNVDFNQPMRAALSTVLNSEDVGLKIGADHFELERTTHSVIERKVKVPVRWLKGFVEVQAYQSALHQAFEVSALELLKCIRTLPTQGITQVGTVTYLVPAGKGLRLSQRVTPGAVAVGAVSRLKILEPILRYAKTVRIYAGTDAISGFELSFPEGKFFFVLSADAARGFSGEGQALSGLSLKAASEALIRVKSALHWQDTIDPQVLSGTLGIEQAAVLGALQILGARGLVGYDLASSSFFHRELPFDLSIVEELQPRLKKARELVEQNQVRVVHRKGENVESFVKGSASEYNVQITTSGARCTCDWFAKNQGKRGPCSHILATDIFVQDLKS